MVPTHNTRTGAEWVRSLAESNKARRIALVGPTATDARDVMIEGESGILAISPPWFLPKYEPSKRRLTWPNGVIATAYSAEEPERLRGPQHSAAWCDELAVWSYPQAWDNLMLGLRLGVDPRVCVTTTPKPVRLVKALLAEPTTAIVRGTTHENRPNLAAAFFEKILATYEGTRLGQQEIYAEVLEVSDGAWFTRFDPAKHITEAAEYDHRFRVYLAIDCGVSRHVGAVFFQVRELGPNQHRVTVFGDYHAEGFFSEENAKAIRAKAEELPCLGRIDVVRLDPASSARTGVGPAAYGEFERVFGSRIVVAGRSIRSSTGSTSSRSCSIRAAWSSTPVVLTSRPHSRTIPAPIAGANGWTSPPTPSTRTKTSWIVYAEESEIDSRKVGSNSPGCAAFMLESLSSTLQTEDFPPLETPRTMLPLIERWIPREGPTMPIYMLTSIQYSERIGSPKEWVLNTLTLGSINLIVGTNATGKTRAVTVINSLARMLLPDNPFRILDAGYDVHIELGGRHLRYVIQVEDGRIVKEEFY